MQSVSTYSSLLANLILNRCMTVEFSNDTKSHMDSSFLTLPPSYEEIKPLAPPSLSEPPIERGRSPSFLSSMKTMVQSPLKRMRSPARSQPSGNKSLSVEWEPQPVARRYTSRHSHCGVHTGPCQNSTHATHRSSNRRKMRRREPIPSMADYLTLAQLEVVWRSKTLIRELSRHPGQHRRESRMRGLGALRIRKPLTRPMLG